MKKHCPVLFQYSKLLYSVTLKFVCAVTLCIIYVLIMSSFIIITAIFDYKSAIEYELIFQ